jgi:hypothetical protein
MQVTINLPENTTSQEFIAFLEKYSHSPTLEGKRMTCLNCRYHLQEGGCSLCASSCINSWTNGGTPYHWKPKEKEA